MSSFKLLISVIAVTAGLLLPGHAQNASPEKSIVRVNATLQSYSFLRPWEKGAPTPRRGLGAVLKGDRVLVTAEMCVNSTYLELEHPSSGAKVPAKITALDYEANLAILEPTKEDSGVFAELEPLALETSAKAGDILQVWQIEDNGNGVTTEVDVLRVSVGRYFIPGSVFLRYQVKGSLQARVNSFTLPVVKNGKLCGMLLSYSSKDQTASVLPAPIIESFLKKSQEGDYAGFPNLGVGYSQTLDDTLREFVGLNGKGGIFVRNIANGGSADKAGLKKGDVILSIGGNDIDARGNYDHPEYGKLSFSHLVRGGAKVGDVLKVEIIRDSEPMSLDVKLLRKSPEDFLIDPYMFDRGPKYVIFGGMIFQELTLPYLESWGDDWANRAPFKLVFANSNPEAYEEEGREKLVFLSNVLKTPSTLGYEAFNSVVVTDVNGISIKNINDLAEALATAPDDGIHTIEFSDFPKIIYVDDKASKMVNEQLIQYGINKLQRLQ
tara:strand:+ start:890 stop:2371 length:1482 start_codon:yes stop_codon:yes gene_type:complete